MKRAPVLYIKFEKVGTRRVAYPANGRARTFAKLEATETLTGRALGIAKELGFKVYVITSPAGSAYDLAAYINPDGRAS